MVTTESQLTMAGTHVHGHGAGHHATQLVTTWFTGSANYFNRDW
ncbi:hypothetical protein [uncultured Limosilactobacillus sp.]|nr:hypothetical protein [uncultured Limosilactobacillus sp.]